MVAIGETPTGHSDSPSASGGTWSETDRSDRGQHAPLQPDQEWANALTHALGTLGTLVVGSQLVFAALSKESGLAVACAAYVASVFGTFLFSTLSHVVRRQPLLNTMRAWDQGMIYAMISGTYTPIAYYFAPQDIRLPLLCAIWVAAGLGFVCKVALRHRVNAIGTISYLLLGWLPAIPLAPYVPTPLAWCMLVGGILYTIGVVFLLNDSRIKYMHALWHISVISAAACHYFGILHYIVQA